MEHECRYARITASNTWPSDAAVYYSVIHDTRAMGERRGLEEEIIKTVNTIRTRYSLDDLGNNPVIRALRQFYWRIEIDPTKKRPSSEALVRRILRGNDLPRINCIVDSGNLASLITLVPVGLYDLDKVPEPKRIMLRRALPGEVFEPIGGKPIILKGGEPVMVSGNIIMFLYPYRDSVKTMISSDTRRVLVVAAGVPGIDDEQIARTTNLVSEYITRFCGGRIACSTTRMVREGA